MTRNWMKAFLTMALALIMCASVAIAQADVVIACVGDSLTYGVIPNTAGKQTEHPYPAVLAELLGEGYDVQNYGKPGSALTENGVCYRNRDGYQLSLDAKAQMVILMFGTNDSNPKNTWDAELFESDLANMVDAYREANPDAVICLMAPPENFPDASTGEPAMNEALLRGEIRDIVSRVAQEKDALYVDLFAVTEDHPEWFGDDGIHLLDEGYVQMGHAIYDVIAEAAQAL